MVSITIDSKKKKENLRTIMLKSRQMPPSDFMGPAESILFISSLHRLPPTVHS